MATQLRRYRSFDRAREFVIGLGLRSRAEWVRYSKGRLPGKGKRPDDIPAAPHWTYENDGWLGWGDWLGTGWVSNRRRQFRPFRAARLFARRLGLKSQGQWRRYCKGRLPGKGRKPGDIPAAPERTYRRDGWRGWGDWLGTGTVAPQWRRYRGFAGARAFVRRLGLQSQAEWIRYCKGDLRRKGTRPDDIPTAPHRTYEDSGWVGWGDWLGTGTVASRLRRYRAFRRARALVRKLGLRSEREWTRYCMGKLSRKGQKPADIPAAPCLVYQNTGWVSWGDWLGTGSVAPQLRHYRAFRMGRAFVRQLGLRSQKEWRQYCGGRLFGKRKKPDDIPSDPYRAYWDHGWMGWGDWLGTGTTAPWLRPYRPFSKARALARRLGLRGRREWVKYCRGTLPGKGKRPADLPAAPHHVYRDAGWVSWGDWLGTQTVANQQRQFRPFREARAFVRGLGLASTTQWSSYCKGELDGRGKRPDDIPAHPARSYQNDGWRNWGDWLGVDTKASQRRRYPALRMTRTFVRPLSLRSPDEWAGFSMGNGHGNGAKPGNILATPYRTHRSNGWLGRGKCRGTARPRPSVKPESSTANGRKR